ncbi:site-specific recombinase [Massilia yuzhufengensis]|uniref:Site-specific recombinase n=1 Tax=Massilia yuzhufengensis TaxID=1164594 RepID=A0A1I1F2L7_9BURK|nr:site-specific recombinase [Massilia yuzhufengensis]SFB93574.1 Site-specific recombinase [Massilia yuzhufengensis]
MLAILERINPDSDRIDLLVELVDCLRPRHRWVWQKADDPAQAVRTLTQLLRGNQAQAWNLRHYITTLLERRRHTSLYSDIGILSNDGFVAELKRRITYRFLPPALNDLYLSDALNQVLYAENDYEWIRAVPNADWMELFDVIANAPPPAHATPDRARYVTVMGILDAIRTLSCRVCALGLEPRLVHSYSEIEHFDSPFLMQNIEVNDFLDEYARYLDGKIDRPEPARHLLVMLDQCEDVVLKIRRGAQSTGTSVALTYLLVALQQSIDRLHKLLYLVDVTGELPSAASVDLDAVASSVASGAGTVASDRRLAAIALAEELIEAHNTKYQVRGLMRDNVDLLARNMTENASRTGEHYIAENRRALRHMFVAASGAGFIVGFMAMFKIMLGYLRTAPLVEAFLFSMNYSLGFILIYVLHFTVATKQPAMTAQHIAASLHQADNGRGLDVDSLAELVCKVFRTQIVAVLGNVALAFPVAWLIAVGYKAVNGSHMVDPLKAHHLLADIDPFHGPALFYAAIAGVWLFVAGLISGYYDNKALYTRMGQRVRQLRGLRRLLGEERQARFAAYVEDNLGGLMGNFFFGCMLGMTGTVGYLLGLPLDIRHVTFSTANFATALVALDYQLAPAAIGTAAAGVALIGTVNLVVSFGLALWVAMRARKIRFKRGILLVRALGRRLFASPIDFFLGPKDHADSSELILRDTK